MSNPSEKNLPSLATGAALSQQTFDDFVTRLRHDCEGAGVSRHYTRDAIFIVQACHYVYGIDLSYDPDRVIVCDEQVWVSPKAYWDELDEQGQSALDEISQKEGSSDFLQAPEHLQWEIVGGLPDHSVIGRHEQWVYVCAHFTRDAADAFIKRKAHDYRDGLRVYVDAQTYSWEWNAIKEALISGRLKLVDGTRPA